MRRAALLLFSCLTVLLTVATGWLPRILCQTRTSVFGTLACGGTTYQVVSANNAPVGQVLTANGSNSTSANIMIKDKAASFPQNMLTLCTAYPPPPNQPFQAFFLITPAIQ
jgi:hypothetical protein